MRRWGTGKGLHAAFAVTLAGCGAGATSTSLQSEPTARANVAAPDRAPRFVRQGITQVTAISHDQRMLASVDAGLAIADVKTGRVRGRYPRCVSGAAFVPDDSAMVVIECAETPRRSLERGTEQPEVRVSVWELATDTTRELAKGRFTEVRVSEDGRAAMLSSPQEAASFEIATGHLILRRAFDGREFGAFVNPDLLVVSGVSPVAEDASGHRTEIGDREVSPDGKLAAGAGGVAALGVKEAAPLAWDARCTQHWTAWSADSKRFALVCFNGGQGEHGYRAAVFDRSGKQVCALSSLVEKQLDATFSDDGARVMLRRREGSGKPRVEIFAMPASPQAECGSVAKLDDDALAWSPSLGLVADLDASGVAFTSIPSAEKWRIPRGTAVPGLTLDRRGRMMGSRPGESKRFSPEHATWSNEPMFRSVRNDYLLDTPVGEVVPVRGGVELPALQRDAEYAGASLAARIGGKLTPLTDSASYVTGYPYPRLSPLGKFAVAFHDGKIGLWDASTGKMIGVTQGVEDILFDPTESVMYVSGERGALVDLKTGKERWTVSTKPEGWGGLEPRHDAWSPRGARLSVMGLGVVDAATGKILAPNIFFVDDPWSADEAAFVAPSAWLQDSCTARSGAELEVRNATDGSKIAALAGAVTVVGWSPDRAFLATRDGCGGVWHRIWDAKTWKLWGEFSASTVAWSLDGRFLYAPLGDELLVVRVADRMQIHQVVRVADANALTFTDDGRFDGAADAPALAAYRLGANVRTDDVLDAKDVHDSGACPGLRTHFFRGDPLTCDLPAESR